MRYRPLLRARGRLVGSVTEAPTAGIMTVRPWASAVYELIRIESFLEFDYLYIFKVTP